jgi:hypothetical protein
MLICLYFPSHVHVSVFERMFQLFSFAGGDTTGQQREHVAARQQREHVAARQQRGHVTTGLIIGAFHLRFAVILLKIFFENVTVARRLR